MSCSHQIVGIWNKLEPSLYECAGAECTLCGETWDAWEIPSVTRPMTTEDYDALFLRQCGMTMEAAEASECGSIIEDDY